MTTHAFSADSVTIQAFAWLIEQNLRERFLRQRQEQKWITKPLQAHSSGRFRLPGRNAGVFDVRSRVWGRVACSGAPEPCESWFDSLGYMYLQAPWLLQLGAYLVQLLRTVYTRAGVELTDPQESCKLEDIKVIKILVGPSEEITEDFPDGV